MVRKKKNSGFTLMELLLTVVILGIAAGFTYLSINNVGSAAAKEAAADVNYLVSRCRAACLSRTGESYILFKTEDAGSVAEYYENDTLADTAQLGGKRVSCAYNGGNAFPAEGLKLSFERATGAEKTTGGCTEVKDISFAGGGAEYKLSIVPATGSHRLG